VIPDSPPNLMERGVTEEDRGVPGNVVLFASAAELAPFELLWVVSRIGSDAVILVGGEEVGSHSL
jgi:hypothetical protein